MKVIGSRFMNPQALDNITTPDFSIAENRKTRDGIDLGPDCHQFLNSMTEEERIAVREFAEKFYEKAIEGMRARLIHNKAFLQRLIFVEPEVALSDDRNPECIQYLREDHFPSIDSAELLDEWKIIPEQFTDDQKREYSALDVVDFWEIVVELQAEEQPIFPNLKILTEAVF
ncbi:hypothetical protein QAD02_002848 [Eretmocerus hayati]|uniref:Uncharacterized protein n=1 Tax=Eretmocerus hayati TaxID=131215 RepID=A0ACC2NK09_9HYME|nr:hypothetical protein QAD02_002848 [Eretmocerus hayati]